MALALLCLLPGVFAQGQTTPAKPVGAPLAIEVVVRTTENFRRTADVTAFVAQAASARVKVISLLVKQDEDSRVQSGQVFYASRLAPKAPGYAQFDVLHTLLQAAHARNIQVRAWIPQFHDQVAARKNPRWQMMAAKDGRVTPYTGSRQTEYFVNPLHPEVQAYELSLITEITDKYPVDGIMLDWIRFDNYNMDVGETTRAQYRALHGIDPLTLDFSKPGAALEQWNAFRTDGVAAYIQRVRSAIPAHLTLGVYILPPEFTEVGQDAAKFNRASSTLAPMCYFRDWGYPLDWVWSSCLASTVGKAGLAEVTPAMDSKLTHEQYQAILGHLRTDFPAIRSLAWFYHGTWTAQMLQRIDRLSR